MSKHIGLKEQVKQGAISAKDALKKCPALDSHTGRWLAKKAGVAK